MRKIQSFKDLILWKKAHELVLQIYKHTQLFPSVEIYGLTSQMRRAAYSIPANIVEGHARNGIKEFIRFLNISRASLEELKYFTLLARDLKYLTKTNYEILNELEIEVTRILYSFLQNLKQKSN